MHSQKMIYKLAEWGSGNFMQSSTTLKVYFIWNLFLREMSQGAISMVIWSLRRNKFSTLIELVSEPIICSYYWCHRLNQESQSSKRTSIGNLLKMSSTSKRKLWRGSRMKRNKEKLKNKLKRFLYRSRFSWRNSKESSRRAKSSGKRSSNRNNLRR